MKLWVILTEMGVFAALFTAIIFVVYGNRKKDSAAAIHNYPPDIQEEYFKTHERMDISYRSKNVLLTKGMGILMFSLILFACAYFAGARTFWQGFGIGFGLMAWIGIYDTFFLDWVLFANLPMFRLEGTEHMDKAYHQKWFHVKGMIFPGSLFALIVGTIVGLAVMAL